MKVCIPVHVQRTDDGDYAATIPDIAASFARGKNADAAVTELRGWLFARWETAQQFGLEASLFITATEQLRLRSEFAQGELRCIEVDLDQGTAQGPICLVEHDRRRHPRSAA